MSEVADVAASTNVLSLCAGGGGLDLGFRRAVRNARTVCYVENEVTACGVLAARMEDGGLDDAPIWTDLRTFDGTPWRGLVDCITGGYPCQPFSNAGRRLGQDDPRHLWPEVARITAEVEPRLVFFENVGAHLRLGFREVARSLQGMGYRVAATLLTASEVGAPHGRERLFILAHRPLDGRYEGRPTAREDVWGPSASRSAVADSAGARFPRAEDARADRSNAGTYGGGSLEPQRACLDVADADLGSRGPEPREQHPQRAEVAVGAGSGGLADTLSEHLFNATTAGEDRTKRAIAAEAGRAVGHADITRLEGRGEPERGGGYKLPAWPPGPQDTDAWRRVLAIRPDLAPAVEPSVRGVVDGMAGGLGRSDQLHILGNGVSPPQAAYAFALLAEELGL